MPSSERITERISYDMIQRHVYPVASPVAKQKAIVMDLDGTLALHTDRDWWEYDKCGSDAVCDVIGEVYRAYEARGDVAIIVMTGRPETYFNETALWLQNHGFRYHRLFMRAADDRSSNVYYKSHVLNTQIMPNFDVIAAFEDNPPVVEMMVGLGVTVFQPRRPDKPEKYYRPVDWTADAEREGAG